MIVEVDDRWKGLGKGGGVEGEGMLISSPFFFFFGLALD